MFSLILLFLLYFLPAIIGRDKRHATGILLFNFFLGWTGIGWIMAFLWACVAEPMPRVHLLPAIAGGRFCCRCGSATCSGAHFCTQCGCTV